MRTRMKLQFTTTVRRRLTLVSLAVLFSVSVPVAYIQQAAADQYDDQINSLRAQADQYQGQANQLRAQADTLQNKLDEINAQIAALQAKIQANQARHDQLQQKIQENQTKLENSQNLLGEVLANLYVDNGVTAVEMLASSANISDFVDKQEYRSSVRDQLNSLINDVKDIKAKLENDKKEVEKIMAELDLQNQQLGAVQADQQKLVNETRGEEAAYQQLVSSARDQMASVQSQQQAYYASLVAKGGGGSGVVGSFSYWGWSGNQGCAGGYPYCGGQDTTIDPWNLYNRECVSWVAWALENRFGKSVMPFHGDGNAYQWPYSAPSWSGAFRVPSPQRGDAVILPADGGFAPIGHAMIVESVSGDDIFVSQYNMYGTGQYSTMHIHSSGVIFLRFPNA
jgi:peptidoglycan hydrolase CwlO-like protein